MRQRKKERCDERESWKDVKKEKVRTRDKGIQRKRGEMRRQRKRGEMRNKKKGKM